MEREATGLAGVLHWVAILFGLLLVLLGGTYVVCWFALPACGIEPLNRIRSWDMERRIGQIRREMQAVNSAPLSTHGWSAKHGSRYSPLGVFQSTISSIEFADVSDSVEPLVKYKLSGVEIRGGTIRDLSPLGRLDLRVLELTGTEVADLSCLKGKHFFVLTLNNTKITTLDFLRGGSVDYKLDIRGSPIADLSPVKGMPLEEVCLACSKVTDLRPLIGMKLEKLDITDAPIADLTVLNQITCKTLTLSPAQIEQRRAQEAAASGK